MKFRKEKIPKSEETIAIEKSITGVKSQIEKNDELGRDLEKEKSEIIKKAKKLDFSDKEIEELVGEGIEDQREDVDFKKKEISEDNIKNKAQEIYEKRVKEGREGNEQTDWEEAEKELREEKESKDKEIKNTEKEDAEKELSPEKIKSLEELLGKIEEQAKDKLENGPLSSKMKGMVISGLDKWENFGKDEKGVKGFAKRFTKMAVNLALIGVISSISVEKLAEAGIGTATALSGGVTSYLGRKMAVGLGIGGAMELGGKKIPDKVKKWMPIALGIAGIGAATVLSGGLAGVAAGLSAGAGYATSKLIKGKFTNEKIAEREEKAKQEYLSKKEYFNGLLEKGDISDYNVREIEEQYSKILKKYENQRIWGKLLDGATKLGTGALISGISMEASGFARDATHNISTEQSSEKIINENDVPINKEVVTNEPDTAFLKNENVTKFWNPGDIQTETQNENLVEVIPPTPEHISVEAIADHGQGAISTLRELQDKLEVEYGNDLDNAPESVQHIINTDAHKLAQEYGMYKPGEDAESAFIKSGAIFKVDENGNLTYQEVGSDKSIILESGNPNIVEADYSGKMSDTDHSGEQIENNNIQEPVNEYKLPEQVNPDTGELFGDKNIDINNLKPETENQSYANFLTEEQKIINETYIGNINHLFPTEKLMGEWDYIKNNISAERLMEMAKDREIKPEFESLIKYIKKLERITDLRPVGESVINPNPESITHFISRALERAQEIGKLDRVKL